jgi:hypothetical protein
MPSAIAARSSSRPTSRGLRAATASRKTPWNSAEVSASVPRVALPESWKLTASHNTQTAGDATTLRPWSSGHPQAPGMWVQIELPQPAMVAGVQFESPAALVDTTPAVPGAPTRTGIGGARGGGPPLQPGFPRGYEVVVSADGTTWSNPVAQGQGKGVGQRDRVHPDAREVRAHPADGQRR